MEIIIRIHSAIVKAQALNPSRNHIPQTSVPFQSNAQRKVGELLTPVCNIVGQQSNNIHSLWLTMNRMQV